VGQLYFTLLLILLRTVIKTIGYGIAQTVNQWVLTIEAWDHAQGSTCVISGGQRGNGTEFSFIWFSHQYYSTAATYSLMYHLGTG
jgi:hypothetical protein